MYELIQAAPSTYTIQSPSKMGLVALGEGHVCLIDSGGDKEAGRKVRQILDAQGWTLDAPSHATLFSNLHFCSAGIPAKNCATNFCSLMKAMPNH